MRSRPSCMVMRSSAIASDASTCLPVAGARQHAGDDLALPDAGSRRRWIAVSAVDDGCMELPSADGTARMRPIETERRCVRRAGGERVHAVVRRLEAGQALGGACERSLQPSAVAALLHGD